MRFQNVKPIPRLVLIAAIVWGVYAGISRYSSGGDVANVVSDIVTASESASSKAVAGENDISASSVVTDRSSNLAPEKKSWTIEFEDGKTKIKPSSISDLEAILAQMAKSGSSVTISGHTDSSGKTTANLALSKRRAEAVRSWINANASSKLTRELIQVHAYGDTMPLAPNTTPGNRAKNRRVEVILMSETTKK